MVEYWSVQRVVSGFDAQTNLETNRLIRISIGLLVVLTATLLWLKHNRLPQYESPANKYMIILITVCTYGVDWAQMGKGLFVDAAAPARDRSGPRRLVGRGRKMVART